MWSIINYFKDYFSGCKRYKEIIDTLKNQALYDSLTGLPNRHLLEDRMLQSIRIHSRDKLRFAVVFIDVDNLKEVNDQYGHECGDSLLIETSKRILDSLRDSDTVCRIGGDEFLAILPKINGGEDNIVLISERIVKNVRAPFMYNNHKIRTSTSIGISIYPTDSKDKDDLIRMADKAMYTSKRKGKDQFTFYNKSSIKPL